MAMHISPQNDAEAFLMKTYALTLRNALRMKRLYVAAKNGQEVVFSSDKKLCATLDRINTILRPLSARCEELEKSFPTLTGCRDTLDPTLLIPLYKSTYEPGDAHDREVGCSTQSGKPSMYIRYVLNTNAPFRYFLYRDNLWVASNKDSYPACAACVDNLLAPKVKGPLRVRQGISEAVRIFVWRRDQGQCARCESKEKLEFDHIVPVVRGGSNTARNIELLCETCNRKKGSRIINVR
ncbi:MAG TPA: HNH endonuclease [Edaphobacter sp.]|nr:HNH endonuclease [Edaphobacter sp.]HTF68571.1 HNH endonuclease [Edaphobacter sp.]